MLPNDEGFSILRFIRIQFYRNTLPENVWMKGRWWDTLVYGVLDREWRGREG